MREHVIATLGVLFVAGLVGLAFLAPEVTVVILNSVCGAIFVGMVYTLFLTLAQIWKLRASSSKSDLSPEKQQLTD